MNQVDTSGTDIGIVPIGAYLKIKDQWEEVRITVVKKSGVTVTFIQEENGLVTVMNYRNFNVRYQITFDHGVVSDYTMEKLRNRYKSVL